MKVKGNFTVELNKKEVKALYTLLGQISHQFWEYHMKIEKKPHKRTNHN
jgi:hypothetical protein